MNGNDEKEYFLQNLSMLLASGVDVTLAVDSIKKEIRSKSFRSKLEILQTKLVGGSSLWQALEAANLFAGHIIALIRLGEESGKLPENLQMVVRQQEKTRQFRSKVKSAMLYPLFIFTFTIIIGFGIAWFLLPRLASVFANLNMQLPLITRILIALGKFLGQYGIIVMPLLAGIFILIFYLLFFNKKTKPIGQSLIWTIPGINQLTKEGELANFGFILSSLLSAGLPLTEGLTFMVLSTDLPNYQKFYSSLQKNIETGNSVQSSIALYPHHENLIPYHIQQMIQSAESSGRLPETLQFIGQYYEERLETTSKNLSVLMEPILLIIVWLGVLAVALAVILPIYSLIGGLNK